MKYVIQFVASSHVPSKCHEGGMSVLYASVGLKAQI